MTRILPLLVVAWTATARADVAQPPLEPRRGQGTGEATAASPQPLAAPPEPASQQDMTATRDGRAGGPISPAPEAGRDVGQVVKPDEQHDGRTDGQEVARGEEALQLNDLPPPSIGAIELLGPLAKTMAMLAVVLAIAYLTLHKGLGKLVERQNVGKRMRVVERTALDAKRTLFLVDVDGQQMILAAGEGGVVHLKDLGLAPDSGEKSLSSPGLGARFAAVLQARPTKAPPVTTGLPRTDPAAATGPDIEKVRG